MNCEHDEPECLEWTWEGIAILKAAREKAARMAWLHQRIRDFTMGRPTDNAAALNALRASAVSRPQSLAPTRLASPRQLPWSAASVVDLGASFPQPGDPDFVPSTAWQLKQHDEAMGRKRA